MKKIGYFFFSFLPLFASVALQLAAAFPVLGLCLIQVCYAAIFSGSKMSYAEFAMRLNDISRNPAFTSAVSVVFASCGILIFGLWYAKQFNGSLKQPAKLFSNPKILLGILLLVPGLQVISSFFDGIFCEPVPWLDGFL